MRMKVKKNPIPRGKLCSDFWRQNLTWLTAVPTQPCKTICRIFLSGGSCITAALNSLIFFWISSIATWIGVSVIWKVIQHLLKKHFSWPAGAPISRNDITQSCTRFLKTIPHYLFILMFLSYLSSSSQSLKFSFVALQICSYSLYFISDYWLVYLYIVQSHI